jgi:uncharacterized protein
MADRPRLRACRAGACTVLALLLASLGAAGPAWAAAPAAAPALQPIPKLEARVTDLTGTLTAGEQADLEQKLRAFEARKGAQIAVLVVSTTQPEDIEQYSIRVVDQWKLGRAKPDDGVLVLLAKDDRATRIEVGYGLEGALTDATSNRIIDETMIPLFRQGQYYAGLSAGVDQIIRVVDGEPLPPPDTGWEGGGNRIWGMLPALLIGVVFVSSILRAVLGRVGGAAATAGLAGILAWVVSQVLFAAIGFAVLAFLLSLVLGLGGGGWTSGRRGGFGGFGGWGGGGFGGGGFGGGGGGFSGGGGGFGGGGASGRW